MSMIGNRNDRRTLSEINVTPLVDVMLVLLVIFMITAPLMKMGTNIDLPEAKLDPLEESQQELIIQITSNKTVHIGDSQFQLEELSQKIGPIKAHLKPGVPIYIAADRAVPYGFVMQVLEALKEGGLDQFGLMTRPHEKGGD